MRKSSNLGIEGCALIVGIVGIIVAVVAWLSPFNPVGNSPFASAPTQASISPPISPTQPSACVVPNVVGQYQGVAENLITSLGLNTIRSTTYDPNLASGVVVFQDPAGGTRISPCIGEVLVVVSLGAIPTSTDTPMPTSTPKPTSVPPSPTPIPEPPGAGEAFNGDGLSIKLIDYEIRPMDHPEGAAVRYRISFINQTSGPVEIVFSLSDISGIDNLQTQYGDYFALAAAWYGSTGRYQCVSISTPSYPINQQFTLDANSETAIDLFLNVVGTSGDCQNWGVGRSRVSFETNYVDVTIGSVKYRTDQLHEFKNLRWRLKR